MPLLFFIDKDILDDPSCRNVGDVVLSYTFFRFVGYFSLLLFYLTNKIYIAHGGTNMANWSPMPQMTLSKNRLDFQPLSTLRKRKEKRLLDRPSGIYLSAFNYLNVTLKYHILYQLIMF